MPGIMDSRLCTIILYQNQRCLPRPTSVHLPAIAPKCRSGGMERPKIAVSIVRSLHSRPTASLHTFLGGSMGYNVDSCTKMPPFEPLQCPQP